VGSRLVAAVTPGGPGPRWYMRQAANGQWTVGLKAGSNEKELWSESFTRKADARRALKGYAWDALRASARLLFGIVKEER